LQIERTGWFIREGLSILRGQKLDSTAFLAVLRQLFFGFSENKTNEKSLIVFSPW